MQLSAKNIYGGGESGGGGGSVEVNGSVGWSLCVVNQHVNNRIGAQVHVLD